MDVRGNIEEIFDSVQAEGPFAGIRQVFIRFAGCNLSCAFCDTPQAKKPVATCRFEIKSAGGQFEYLPNPLSVEEVREAIGRLWKQGYHSISITGGEPLVQADFLLQLLPALRNDGHEIYLETNATYPEQMQTISRYVSYVAADIKISSCSGEPNRFDENVKFLEASGSSYLFVKIVVTDRVDEGEFLEAVRLASKAGDVRCVVIQPARTRRGDIAVGTHTLLELQRRALEIHPDVRVIPGLQQSLRIS